MLHGANSSSPSPIDSLLVGLPLATSSSSSKICGADLVDRRPVEDDARR